MSTDLDKTIEDLETEIIAELDEAARSADGKGKSEPMQKGGDAEDLGKAVTSPEDKLPDASKGVKKDSSKSASKNDGDQSPKKLKEGEHEDDEEEDDSEEKSEKKNYGTKSAAINAMNDMMKKMNAKEVKDLAASYHEMAHGDKKEVKEDSEFDESTFEERLSEISVQEDVEALTSGEDLSEEFKEKASIIFESAVKSKIRSEIERIEESKSTEIAEEVESFKTQLTEKVDAYLDYVVQEWVKENELAIERGLKGEIAEDFISGLKSLFEEHYIDVPDEKYDVLESQATRIDELEEKLNESIDKLTEMNQEKSSLVRESVITEVSSDLADTESEKFKGLVEDVEFTDEESFTEKLNTLKGNYFPKTTPHSETETFVEESGTEEIDVSGSMAAYMSAIERTNASAFNSFKSVKK